MSLASKIASLLDAAGLISSDRLPAYLFKGFFKNLKITNGATPDSQVTITADVVVLADGSGISKQFAAVNVTASSGSVGANALDAGTVANSTWYAIWLIGKSDGTVAALLSTSGTAPTMPSGYTYKYRLGWVRTDGTAKFNRFVQRDKKVRYMVVAASATPGLPLMVSAASGNTTTPSYTTLDVSPYVPSTAAAITVLLRAITAGGSGQRLIVMNPSPAYGLGANGVNPPVASSVATDATQGISPYFTESTIQFETAQTLYYACQATCYANCMGWEDNI